MIQAVRLRLKGPLCVPACCQRKRIDLERTFSVSEMGQKPSAGHVRCRPSLARSRHSALGQKASASRPSRMYKRLGRGLGSGLSRTEALRARWVGSGR